MSLSLLIAVMIS